MRVPSLGARRAACDNRVAVIALNPKLTAAPVVAIGRAKTGLDTTFVIGEAP